MLRGVVGGWWLCSCNDIPVRPRQDPRRDLNLFELRTRSPAPREPGESRGRCAGYSREEHCVCRPAPHSSRHLHLSRSFLILVMSQWMWPRDSEPQRVICHWNAQVNILFIEVTIQCWSMFSPSVHCTCRPPPSPAPRSCPAPRPTPGSSSEHNTTPHIHTHRYIYTIYTDTYTDISTQIYCTNWLLWQNI